MTTPASWRGVVNKYSEYPKDVRDYFEHVPRLVQEYPFEVCLAYQFSRVEVGQHMAIYCGVVKTHRADLTLAQQAVQAHPMYRDQFRELFKTVFGKPLATRVVGVLEEAEAIRDKIMHGKTTTEAAKRKGVVDVLKYAHAFNDQVDQLAGFRPYGRLQGFKGRAKSLDQSTTRWLLKGLGLALS